MGSPKETFRTCTVLVFSQQSAFHLTAGSHRRGSESKSPKHQSACLHTVYKGLWTARTSNEVYGYHVRCGPKGEGFMLRSKRVRLRKRGAWFQEIVAGWAGTQERTVAWSRSQAGTQASIGSVAERMLGHDDVTWWAATWFKTANILLPAGLLEKPLQWDSPVHLPTTGVIHNSFIHVSWTFASRHRLPQGDTLTAHLCECIPF